MIKVDSFLDRVSKRGYRCFDFVREVWLDSFGVDVGNQLESLNGALSGRKLTPGDLHKVTKIDAPIDPCFVVFQRKRTTPHIGIWYRGNILHLASSGAEYTRVHFIARRYQKVSYYIP